jgi:hypothetical protein
MAVETNRNRSSRFPDADRVQPAHDPAGSRRREEADRARQVKPLREPNSYVGDGATGNAKNLRGFFPAWNIATALNAPPIRATSRYRRMTGARLIQLSSRCRSWRSPSARTANRRKSNKPGFRARFNQRSTVAHDLGFEISNFEPDIQCHRFAALESAVTLG